MANTLQADPENTRSRPMQHPFEGILVPVEVAETPRREALKTLVASGAALVGLSESQRLQADDKPKSAKSLSLIHI